jgi:NtrC-family two-component system sensor histidine kinase KinB
MSPLPRPLGLSARFLTAGALLTLTAAAASAWTLWVLSQLASAAEATVHNTDEVSAAVAAVMSSLEREDDALLEVLSGVASGLDALTQARTVSDLALTQLTQATTHEARVTNREASVRAQVQTYRLAVERALDHLGPEPLEQYHVEVNPRLRAAVSAASRIRDLRFEEARQETARARDAVRRARGVVALISALSVAMTAVVASRLARRVVSPLRQLAAAVEEVRQGRFGVSLQVTSRDEIGQVAAAFNQMTQQLEAFHRANVGEVIRAKHTLETMMSALPDAVLLIDASGQVASMNPAAARLFTSANTPPPQRADAVVAPFSGETERLQRALHAQEGLDVVSLQAALTLNAAGEERQLLPRVVTLHRDEEAGGLIVVLSDVTQLARLDRLRMEVLAVASHELRTPITTLRMTLLMMREDAAALPRRMQDLIETALGGAEQLDQTVNELLDLTKIEAGQLRLSFEPLQLEALTQEALSRWAPRADELGVSLIFDAPQPLPSMRGDAARLRVVLDNLLSNALKYTPRGGSVTARLRVMPPPSAGSPASLTLDLSDTGPGIPSPLRDRVFEKFFRVEHQQLRPDANPSGVGIGLYLCRQIVEQHHGEITCEPNDPAPGARLIVRLPCAGEPISP